MRPLRGGGEAVRRRPPRLDGAACLRRYPFGGHAKLSLYAAPLVAILAGSSLALLAPSRAGRRGAAQRAGKAGALVLLAVGLATAGRDLAWPYKNASDEEARRFARAFWTDSPRQAETVCLASDLGASFQPSLRSRLSWFATGFLAWLSVTDCDTLVAFERLAGAFPWEEVAETALHAELGDLLRAQRRFPLVWRRAFPLHACAVSVSRRSGP